MASSGCHSCFQPAAKSRVALSIGMHDHVSGSCWMISTPACTRRLQHMSYIGYGSHAAKSHWTVLPSACLQLQCMSRTGLSSYVATSHGMRASVACVGIRYKSRNGSRVFAAATSNSTRSAEVDVDLHGDNIADDYYSVLGVPHDATPEEIKKAYYSCMKACHPDLAGEKAETTTFCMFVNEVYEILSDPIQRMVYDEINGYSLASINPFLDVCRPQDHVFVDEFSCIGCKNCSNVACKSFEMEELFGRARAISQCGRTPVVQQAIDTCPVDCIHWVTAPQLSLLEDEMRRMERVNVGVMLSGMGRISSDVFSSASRRWEKKQIRAVEAAKIRMMKEKRKQSTGPWWQDLWSQNSDESSSQKAAVDPEVQERAAKAAAAARRWREYSRKGVDRKPIYNLPSSLTSDTEKENENQSFHMAEN